MRTTNVLICMVALFGLALFAVSAQAGTIGYRNTVLGDSPIVYYEFDETGGSTAANSGSTGGGNTGTISGTVAINQSSFPQGGTSYDFGGGHVVAAAAPSSLTEWTLEAWINWDPAKTSGSNIFGNDQGGWNDDVLFGIRPEAGHGGVPASNLGLVQQGNPGATRDTVTEPLSHSVWHHVVATGSTTNGELKLYVDGALTDTDSSLANGITLNGAGGFGTPFIAVGAARNVTDAGYRSFDGLIDEFALYETVLDATTVEAHYDAGAGVVGPTPLPIADLFNTGVDGSGTPLADGTIGDPHYTLSSVPSGTTDIRVRTSAGGWPIGPWLGDNATSAWIGPNNAANLHSPAGNYVYSTTFTIPTTADLSTVVVTGGWGTDNPGTDILINGGTTGNTSAGFGSLTPFSIGSGFQYGLNTLDFLVNNSVGGGLNPTGLRVDDLVGTYQLASAIPEPATMCALGLAVAGLSGYIRKRRRA